jgi:hypothetical protein
MKKYTSLEHTARLVHEGKTNLLNPKKNAGGQSPAYTEHAGYTGVFKSKSMGSSIAAGRARSMPYTSGATMAEGGEVPNEGNATPTAKAYGSFDEDGGKKKKIKEEVEQVDEIAPLVAGALALGARALPYLATAGRGALSLAKDVAVGAGVDAAANALTGGSNSSQSSGNTSDIPDTPGQAPVTTAPKTSVGGQTPTKRLKRTVKEETGPDNTRRKDSSKELVGRPNSVGVKDPKSVLGRNASIKDKIISENKKLAGIVKKTKEEQESSGPNVNAKTKDMGNVIFNPPLKKPDLGSYNH